MAARSSRTFRKCAQQQPPRSPFLGWATIAGATMAARQKNTQWHGNRNDWVGVSFLITRIRTGEKQCDPLASRRPAPYRGTFKMASSVVKEARTGKELPSSTEAAGLLLAALGARTATVAFVRLNPYAVGIYVDRDGARGLKGDNLDATAAGECGHNMWRPVCSTPTSAIGVPLRQFISSASLSVL